MGRGVGWLLAVAGALWLASVPPAAYWAGPAGPWVSLLAAGVCLVPAMATWIFVCWSSRQTATWQLAGALAGMPARILFVLGLGGWLLWANDAVRARWVLFAAAGVAYYLATLATETWLALRSRQRRARAPGGDS